MTTMIATPVFDPTQPVTPLTGHARFFASDKGVITVSSIYNAFRSLGFNTAISGIAAVAFRVAGRIPPQGDPSQARKVVNPVASGVFDTNGRVDKPLFESIWGRFDVARPGCLTRSEFQRFLADRTNSAVSTTDDSASFFARGIQKANSVFRRIIGRAISILESRLLFRALSDGQLTDGTPVISKERLYMFYTSSYDAFTAKAAQLRAERKNS